MMTTLRRSGSGIGRDTPTGVEDGADGAEDEPEDQVRGPDAVAGDRGQADETDAEHDDDGDADHGDDDAAGGDDGGPNRLVVDRRHHGVDRVEGTGGQRVRKIVLSHRVRLPGGPGVTGLLALAGWDDV